MRGAATQLDDLLVEDVKGFLPGRQTDFVIDRCPKLTVFVITPVVDLRLGRLGELIGLMQLWRQCFSADYHGKVGSAGDLFDF